MKVAVKDAATLALVRPLDMTAYLRARGWQHDADLENKASVWFMLTESGREFDLTLPLRRDFADYTLRVAEVLETLAEVENRSQLAILRDVQSSTADLIRVRAPGREAEAGTLPLNRAVALVERSREMMLAAACATIRAQPLFAPRKPQQALDYIDQVKMGQTEQGSFVLTILSPVPPELKSPQGALFELERPQDPYERLVTRTLMVALHALDDATRVAAVAGDMSPFQEAVELGVSANLCDAIIGLAGVSSGEGVDINVAWSSTRLQKPAAPSRIVFASDSIPIIEEASRHLRATAPSEDYELEGVVTALARNPEAKDGTVTITGYAEGRMRQISVPLKMEAYYVAMDAHRNYRTVRCVGDLEKAGRGYRLIDARHFQILQSEVVNSD